LTVRKSSPDFVQALNETRASNSISEMSTNMSDQTSEPQDEKKREALRKAGQEYFERVLAEASTGKDPFAPEPISEKNSGKPRSKDRWSGLRRQRSLKEDPDLEAVGAILSGVRMYVLTAVFVLSSGVGFVFFKVRVLSLRILKCQRLLSSVHFKSCFDLYPRQV